MITFDQIKDKVHDASGIHYPRLYSWVMKNNVYHPHEKLPMKEFIKLCLVEMHKTATTDKYGQIGMFNFSPAIFGENKAGVEMYCKQNKGILEFSTYGGKHGTYKAFTIQDVEIKQACSEALKINENRIRNLNQF